MLQAFLQQQEKPVIIEIEPPKSGDEKRRAEFYIRNGFSLSESGYVQPAYSHEKSPVSIVLMSYPKPLQGRDFQAFKNWMFTHIYL